MVYVFYIACLVSFCISNVIGFIAIAQNFDIGVYEAFLLSSFITGFLYGAVFRWVITTPLILTINELLEYIHPIVIETNPGKSRFSDAHRAKLRLSSLKRTRDTNGRFK